MSLRIKKRRPINLITKNQGEYVNIRERLFIVGCVRSGTTLLQSLLAAHPQITSFPETHFFPYVTGSKLQKLFRIASPEGKVTIYKFLKDINEENFENLIPKNSFLVKDFINSFVKILDNITIKRGKIIWLEKTPRHLYYIDIIEKYIRKVKFIHIVRNGEDVVASLYDINRTHPDLWRIEGGIDSFIDRWNKDIKITKRHINKSNHFLVKFDELLQNTEFVLGKLCTFIGVDFSKKMLERDVSITEKLILENEPWKTSVKGEITKPIKKKFDLLFDENQKKYIKNNLEIIDFNHDLSESIF